MNKVNQFKVKTWIAHVKSCINDLIEIKVIEDKITPDSMNCRFSFKCGEDTLYMNYDFNPIGSEPIITIRERLDMLSNKHLKAMNGTLEYPDLLMQILMSRYHFEGESKKEPSIAVMTFLINEALKNTGSYKEAFNFISSIDSLSNHYLVLEKSLLEKTLSSF